MDRQEEIARLEEKLMRLKVEHRALDRRLEELEAQVSLTTEEQLEEARLKKEKLRKKDEMAIVEAKIRKLREDQS